jgi:hypothetical protein
MDPRLSLLVFPQRFDGAQLELRLLVVPRLSTSWNGDPLAPLIENFPNAGDTTPAFADADLQLELRVLAGLDRFPVNAPVDFSAPLPQASGVRADARALFERLIAAQPDRFKLSAGGPKLAEPVRPAIFIQKYLPRTYRDSFLFTGARTDDAKTDDSYHCAVKEKKDPNPAFLPSLSTVNWGQIYAYCLRHPQLAMSLGLLRTATVTLDMEDFVDGGFIYAAPTPNSSYAAQVAADPLLVKSYAARLPALVAGTPRTLFAAVLFPVVFDDPLVPGPPSAPGNFDAVFIEAADYDDGFAKIVHGNQPVSQNLLAEERDGFAPLTDIGIRLGWDDEQTLIWQNRQLKEDKTVPVVPLQPQRLDAPMGVFGYRIDARQTGTADWHSLVRVRSKAPLVLDGIALGAQNQRFEGELSVEVHPMQLDGYQDTSQFWLPAYMAQWNGQSLVLPDEDAAAIYKTDDPTASSTASLGRMYEPVGLQDIELRYGHSYDFRVRLMDPTGGGPTLDAAPVHEAPAPVATVPFRRHVVPESVRIADLPRFPDAPLDALFAGNELAVGRPLLGYPNVVFTGKYADPVARLHAASNAAVGKDSFGIPDPDVQRVRIEVEVRTLRQDNLQSLSGRDAYIHLYTTQRAFPADFDTDCRVPLDFRDAHVLHFGDPNDLGDLAVTQAEIDALEELVLPSARDIRLTVRAVAPEDPAYFATGANVGKPVQVRVRRESAAELGLIAAFSEAKTIRGIYLQPDPPTLFNGTLNQLLLQRSTGADPSIIERLSQQLGTDHKGLTLVGRKGERIVFGCSRRIRHTLAPDNSALTFAAKDDLVGHWLIALTCQLDRDWTWDGLQPVSFEIFREQRFKSDIEIDDNGGKPIGDWEVIPTASIQALHEPQRSRTTLVFVDAVEPRSQRLQPASASETRFPDLIELEYRIEPRLANAAVPTDPPLTLQLELPVTTPPAQVPRIVAAGLALSEYERDERYTQSGARVRQLWLELDEPVRDPNDAYFIRMLAFSPDPLLSDNRAETFTPPEESPLPIDPELIRVISPEQPDDEAGLSAMVQLVLSEHSDRHFLMPLPPGLNADSAEMFGFFTYELRVGHARIWSTAQGRFGRPLRATGVQHPAPTLFCTCQRNGAELIVEAPFAVAVLNGRNITADPPRTEIWALLYAQVRQADGKDFRNILLDDRRLQPVARVRGRMELKGEVVIAIENRDSRRRATGRWTQSEIAAELRELGLPLDSSLSVLCVEMMPTLAALRQPAATAAAFSGASTPEEGPRPLSDALGHFRILRTSPLTPVPDVCCPT